MTVIIECISWLINVTDFFFHLLHIEFLDSGISGQKDLVNMTKLPGYPNIRLRDSLMRTGFDYFELDSICRTVCSYSRTLAYNRP